MSDALTYRDAGVDIDAGNELVERIKPLVKRTFRPEVMGGLGGFGGLFDLSGRYKEPVLVSGTDGVGTKLKLAQILNRHDTIGIDLVGMCVNDVLVQGAEPLFFLDYFATGKLDVDTAVAVVGGIAERLRTGRLRADRRRDRRDAGHVPAGRIRPGRLHRRRGGEVADADGAAIVAGDVLLGVASSGPHSNGYSLVRKILERAGNPVDLDLGGVKLADALMAPTTIYVKSMLELLKSESVHGMAHITGGGLRENIIRVVPDGLGIALDASAIVLPPVFDWLMREGNVAREEMWRTFNCGVGFTVILPRDAVAGASALLARHGLASAVIGEIVPAQGDERVHIG